MDFNLLPRMVKESQALSAEDKQLFLQKLPEMNDVQRSELYEILNREIMNRNTFLRARVDARRQFERRRASSIYRYIERKVVEEEESTVNSLDSELQNA